MMSSTQSNFFSLPSAANRYMLFVLMAEVRPNSLPISSVPVCCRRLGCRLWFDEEEEEDIAAPDESLALRDGSMSIGLAQAICFDSPLSPESILIWLLGLESEYRLRG